MTENELFEKMSILVARRNKLIYNHFGSNFLEEYMDPDQREWYKNNVASTDAEIVILANQISKFLKFGVVYKKVADVFKDIKISKWFNEKKMEPHKKNKVFDPKNPFGFSLYK